MTPRTANRIVYLPLWIALAVPLLTGCPTPSAVDGQNDDPFSARYWAKSYGGAGVDSAAAVRSTRDGGFIVVGASDVAPEEEAALLLKLGVVSGEEKQYLCALWAEAMEWRARRAALARPPAPTAPAAGELHGGSAA